MAMAIGRVTMVPNSAKMARKRLMPGLASRISISVMAPMPMKTRQAMSPLENMKV